MANKKLSDIGSSLSARHRFVVSTCKVGIAGFESLEACYSYKVFYILGKSDINPVLVKQLITIGTN